MDIREYLKNGVLLFDGSMGTYFAEKYRDFKGPCESANLKAPDRVLKIYREYLSAGCRALKTNTFAANPLRFQGEEELLRETVRSGMRIAQEAASEAEEDIFVFADVGPIAGAEEETAAEAYRRMADLFLEAGARHFLFETNGNAEHLPETAEYIRSAEPDAFIIASFAVQPDGYTREGNYVKDLFRRVRECDAIDAFGLNCVSGASHLLELVESMDFEGKALSVMPNAGYPRIVENRMFYDSDPAYFAEELEKIARCGAAIVGGCCGTDPRFIRASAERLFGSDESAGGKKIPLERFAGGQPSSGRSSDIGQPSSGNNGAVGSGGAEAEKHRAAGKDEAVAGGAVFSAAAGGTPAGGGVPDGSVRGAEAAGERRSPAAARREERQESREQGMDADNAFWKKLRQGKRVIAVELDPPRDADGEKFISGARQLKAAGADAITIADCPTARARMDSSLMACKIRRELGIDTLPHMTCRDRNLNATKALLLGLSMEGVRNVLTVTGDPIPSAERDEVKSVYQFNSRMLARYVSSLNETEFRQSFRIYGALNINARRFDIQLSLARKKIENGVSGFLTQPVLTRAAFENLQRAHEELDAKILGGIIPVVSSRNARFMNSEISGITVDDEIIALYEGRTKDECTELAVRISSEIASRIRPYTDGYYLMTPFYRTDIIVELIREINRIEAACANE